MSRADRERPPIVHGDDGIDFNDDSLLDVDNSNSFDLKNELYEMKSKCNAIQYEKNKLVISYENAIKDLKHKNAMLERYRGDKNQKEERNVAKNVNELRYQCQALAEQNDMLKRELQTAFQRNRSTPDFNSQDYAPEVEALEELMQKEARINQLEKELKEVRRAEKQLQEKVSALAKENSRLRETAQLLQEKDKTRRSLNRQVEERQKEINRLKGENAKLEQLSKTLESEKNEAIEKISLLQEEIAKWQIQVSQVRNALFNEKLESKKAMNALRFEVEEEKNRCRGLIDEKGQENRRLRESILTLNDQNQALRQKDLNNSQKLDSLRKQHSALQVINKQTTSNLLNLSAMDRSMEVHSSKQTDYELKIMSLEEELKRVKAEAKQKNENGENNEDLNRLNELEEDLKYKDEIMELMKMDNVEKVTREKELLERIRDLQGQIAQKQKTIDSRQQQIKHLKEDNRYLQLGNEELKQKMETLHTVMNDIETIKRHLNKEKMYLEEKRKEQEQLKEEERLIRIEEEKSPGRKKSSINLSRRSSGQSDIKVAVSRISKRSSLIDADLQKQLQDLTNENYKLRVKLSSAENQVDRKALDLNIMKKSCTNIQQNMFTPLVVESAKKNQPSTLVFENKIQELEKEIAAFRNSKQQGQQFKKGCSKQAEEKYISEIKRLNLYSQQLEKNINLLNDKLSEQTHAKTEALNQLQTIQQESFSHEEQYSQTLTQLNQLLHQYKILKQKYEQATQTSNDCVVHLQEIDYLKGTIDRLIKNYNEKSLMLENSDNQIRKLNQLLMFKQHELKKTHRHTSQMKSHNSSFMSQQSFEQISQQMLRFSLAPDYQKSFDPRGSLPNTRR